MTMSFWLEMMQQFPSALKRWMMHLMRMILF
jgi:hypothetical protein